MEAVFRDDVSGKEASHEVSETATAGELLQEACTLFGREVLDSALEVDGAVVCTGVVGGVSGGEASVGSLGVHSGSSLVLCRSRDRVLAVVAGWDRWVDGEDSLPVWAWDDEVVALAVALADARAFNFVSERLKTSDSFMRDAVARDGGVLKYASVEIRADRQLVLAAVTHTGSAMRSASEELKCDKDFVLPVVTRNGDSFMFVSSALKADKQVVMAAVAQNGCYLEFASKQLKADKQVVLVAVAEDGHSLTYASKQLKADKQVVLTAVTRYGNALRFASEELRADDEVVAAAARSLRSSVRQ